MRGGWCLAGCGLPTTATADGSFYEPGHGLICGHVSHWMAHATHPIGLDSLRRDSRVIQ